MKIQKIGLSLLMQLVFFMTFVNVSATCVAQNSDSQTIVTVEITDFPTNGVANSNGDGYFSGWDYFGEVPLTLSNAYNNMYYSGSDLDLCYGKSHSPYTLTVNSGAHAIVGYDIYFRNSDTSKNTTIVPSKGGSSVTCAGSDEAVLKVTGLDNYKSTTFEITTESGANVAARISKLVVYLTCNDTPVVEEDNVLFDTKTSTYPYRIPALAITRNGEILAFSDYRPCGADIGWGDVDIHLRRSEDNGLTWGPESKILNGSGSGDTAGYGDAAVVADSESDKVRLVCVTGDVKFANSGTWWYSEMRVATILSEDNGRTWSKPVDITDMMYSIVDVKGLFFTSGRIVQSKQIKVGEYYRIYSVLCTHDNWIYDASKNVNYVCYSDDFGETWHKLGGVAIEGGDEAKCEELPNGNLMVSTRMSGGRKFNIFTYQDKASATGSWASPVVEDNKFGDVTSCNGEILIVDARRTADNQPVKLLLHSLSRNYNGVDRSYVSIYHKELDAYETPSDLTNDWSDPYVVSEKTSAYSTMLPTHDNKIAFFFEDEAVGAGYQMTYQNLDLREITGNKYYLGEYVSLGVDDVLALEDAKQIEVLEMNANPEQSGQIFANNGGVNVGEMTLRYTVVPGSWNFVSFPVDGNIDEVSNLNELGFQYNVEGEKSYCLKEYSEEKNAMEGQDGWMPLAEPVVTKGKGYLFCISENEDGQNTPVEVLFKFKSNDLSDYINNMDADMTSLLNYSEAGEDYNRGWNLLGNPYFSNMNPTTTDSFEFGNLAPFIYQYDPQKDSFVTYMRGANEVMAIPPFSSFFVQAIGANPSVLFHNLRGNDNSESFETGEIAKFVRLGLFVDGEESFSDRTDIYLSQVASDDFVLGEDATKMWGGLNGKSNEFATVSGDKYCAVNCVSMAEERELPLMLNLRAPGRFVLKLMADLELEEDDLVEICDQKFGEKFDLRENIMGYTFDIEDAEEAKTRFSVKISKKGSVSSVDGLENDCTVRTNRNTVSVDNLQNGCRIQMFDMSGRMIVDEYPVATSWNITLDGGVYLLKIENEEKQMVKKLLLYR